jgi:hypothetical protein
MHSFNKPLQHLAPQCPGTLAFSWYEISTNGGFTGPGSRDIFLIEQFWGRAVRASHDS